jgi:hypothetical protein
MIIFKCDGCGKEVKTRDGIKPYEWFSKTVGVKISVTKTEHGEQGRQAADELIHACSRRCIEKASTNKNTDSVVLPI